MEETQKISKKLLIFDALLVISIIWIVFVIYSELNRPLKNEALAYESQPEVVNFPEISLEAKSAYVFDVVNNKVLYKKNEFVQLPLASITKLMTALTAVELLPKDSNITIKKEFLNEEGDSGLLVNESWTLKDLLDYSLVVSSNDGARSVASVIGALNSNTDDYNLGRQEFIKKMNDNAKKLGLEQTYFNNESGLDIGQNSGGYGSAIDVSKLVQYMIKNHPDVIEATKYSSIEISSDDKKHKAVNTNIEVNKIPGLIASKTGYTDKAGGNLVIAYDHSIGHPIIVVVLGSTINGRFSDVLNLVKASEEYLNQ